MRRLPILIPTLILVLVGLTAGHRAGTDAAPAGPDTARENEALVRRWFQDFANAGDLAVADELFAPDHTQHDVLAPVSAHGPEGQKALLLALRTGFPDLRFSVEDAIAAADRVVVRWTARGTHHGEFSGLAPTGSAMALPGVSIFRLEGGRIAETWVTYDSHWLLLQLERSPGELTGGPAPAAGPAAR
jgi:steroid delta-isomerase-like uncharacterized protein